MGSAVTADLDQLVAIESDVVAAIDLDWLAVIDSNAVEATNSDQRIRTGIFRYFTGISRKIPNFSAKPIYVR